MLPLEVVDPGGASQCYFCYVISAKRQLRVSWQAAEATAADSCERDDGGARPSAGGLSVGGGGGGGSWRSLCSAGSLNFVIYILYYSAFFLSDIYFLAILLTRPL